MILLFSLGCDPNHRADTHDRAGVSFSRYWWNQRPHHRHSLWISHAIKVKAIILQANAYLLIKNNSFEDDQTATKLCIEAYNLVKNKAHIEAEIICLWNLAKLAARCFDISEAQRKFKEALKIAQRYKLEFADFAEDITADIDYLSFWEKLMHPPKMDLPELSSELFLLQTWYPKYKKQILRYWLFTRGIDVYRAIFAQSAPKNLIVSENIEFVEMISEVLRSLFVTQMYTTHKPTDSNKHLYMDIFPIPKNCPFAFSYGVEVNRDTADSETFDAYIVQSDGTDKPLPYTAFLTADPMEHGFDIDREPQPAVMCYQGYDLPEVVYGLRPMCFKDYSSMLWFLAPLPIESKIDSVIDTLTMCCHCKIIPTFRLDEVAESSASIVAAYDVKIPYSPDNPFEVKLNHKLKTARAILEALSKEDRRDRHEELLAKLRDALSEIPDTVNGAFYFQIALLEFPFRIWVDGPYKQQTFPAILLKPSGYFSVDKESTQRNIALRKAEVLKAEAVQIALCDESDIWSCYEQMDEIRQSGLFSEKRVAIHQAEIIGSLIDKYDDRNEEGKYPTEKTVLLIDKAIDKLITLRDEGFEGVSGITEILANAYYVLAKILGTGKNNRCIDAITEIRNSGHNSDEQISLYLTVLLSTQYLHDESGNYAKAVGVLCRILEDNPNSTHIAIAIAQFIDQCFTNDKNLSAADAVVLLEELQNKGFKNVAAISFITETKKLYLHKPGEDLNRKLNRLKSLMKQLISEMNFKKPVLYNTLGKDLQEIYSPLNESDLDILICFVEGLISDENYSNENTAILAVRLLAALADIQKDEKKIKVAISRIKKIRNHFKRCHTITIALMAAHRPLIHIQKQKQKAATVSAVRSLYKKLDNLGQQVGAVSLSETLLDYVSSEKMKENEVFPVIDELESIVQNSTDQWNHVPRNLVLVYYLSVALHEVIQPEVAYTKMTHLQETYAIDDVELQMLTVRALMACQKNDIEILADCKKILLEKYMASEDYVCSFVSIWGKAISANFESPEFIYSLYELMDGIISLGFENNEKILEFAFVGYSNSVLYVVDRMQDKCMERFIELYAYSESPYLIFVLNFLFKKTELILPDKEDELCSLIQDVIYKGGLSAEKAQIDLSIASIYDIASDVEPSKTEMSKNFQAIDNDAIEKGDYRTFILALMQYRKAILVAIDEQEHT